MPLLQEWRELAYVQPKDKAQQQRSQQFWADYFQQEKDLN